jgi:N-acyl-D-aspartate/D-glutamate deacylase
MMAEFDLVLRGGTVFDGSGGAPYEADIGIRAGQIAAIGAVASAGAEEIDARGRIVTPGFVDIHTHYDGQITWENRLAPSSDHGVTTVVMGNCGVGFAPVRPTDHELIVKLMEGVEDIPDVVMTEGVPWNWESFPDYLNALEKRESDIDFAAQLPHSPLRVYVMGERGANLEPPTEHDLAEMRRLTAEAIKAGALGVSTSHNFGHRFKDGRLAPSVPTEEQEVLALAAGLRDAKGGVFQLLPNYEKKPEERFALIERIARTSERPVSFTFMQNPAEGDAWKTILEGLDRANGEGLEIRGQVMGRPAGSMMGLELSLNPFALHPSFRPLADLPLPEKVAALRDPDMRRRLLAEKPEDPNPFFMFIIGETEMLFPLGDPPNYHPAPEDSVGAIAKRTGRDVMDVIYDALLQRDGHEILYRPLGNTGGYRFQSSGRDMIPNEHTVIALGDGGAHYSMICDAAYTTYFLTYWCRDAEPDRSFDLPTAIRKLARDPAVAVGLRDRGLIREGYKADLNVIDMDRLHLHAPHATYDLPAGGRRLNQKADGYVATIVSGKVTYREGVATGALPGRLVRGAKSAPA